MYYVLLQATEADPKLQRSQPHERLLALLEALLMTNPDELKKTVGGDTTLVCCARHSFLLAALGNVS